MLESAGAIFIGRLSRGSAAATFTRNSSQGKSRWLMNPTKPRPAPAMSTSLPGILEGGPSDDPESREIRDRRKKEIAILIINRYAPIADSSTKPHEVA